jgi:hypothetical protein
MSPRSSCACSLGKALKQDQIIDQGKAKDEVATASIFEHLKVYADWLNTRT